jgi:hypothetical protein
MTAHLSEFRAQLDKAIADGCQIQLTLEGMGSGQALGPAEVVNHGDGCYTMISMVQMGDGRSAQTVRSPMTFTIDRVIWFSSGPVDGEGKPLVRTMGGAAGGIPGRGLFGS